MIDLLTKNALFLILKGKLSFGSLDLRNFILFMELNSIFLHLSTKFLKCSALTFGVLLVNYCHFPISYLKCEIKLKVKIVMNQC